MQHVFVDPDGTQAKAVYVLVQKQTGVEYGVQCGGLSNQQRWAEGFLVPLGGTEVAAPLMNWFWSTFHGHSYTPVVSWQAEKIAELRNQIVQIICWHTSRHDGDDSKKVLQLDEQRLEECTEAWVPVQTPYGAGILVFPNCD